MKEAAGEANLTVVAIILIGVVVAVATPLVNSLMNNAKEKACRTDAGYYQENGEWVGGNQSEYDSCMGNKEAPKNNG